MPIEFNDTFWDGTWASHGTKGNQIKGAILAAGLGKRLDPLSTRYLPKPMFPLGGKVPIAELWVRRFVESGIREQSMNLCVMSETIKDHFRDGAKFACDMQYVEEATPSGTLGGICKQALGKEAKRLPGDKPLNFAPFQGSTVIAPSGDIVTNFGSDLLEEMFAIHKKVGSALTAVLVPIPWERRKDYGTAILQKPQKRKGQLPTSGRLKEFVEKDPNSPSNLNNASIYMIEMDLLRHLDGFRTPASLDAKDPCYDFGKHVFPALLGKLPYLPVPKSTIFWGIEYSGNWFDVGQKRDYLSVNKSLLDGELDIILPYEKFPWGYLGTNVSIDFAKVTIVPPVIIGNHCVIESGATVGPYAVIGDGWTLEKNSTVRHSVLWQKYAVQNVKGSKAKSSGAVQSSVDRRRVRGGRTVNESILAGGDIGTDLQEQTAETGDNGKLSVLSIDHVPEGPRA